MRSALETIQLFWKLQDSRDYTKTVALFSEDAVIEDPFFGRHEGKKAIAAFMARMNEEMAGRDTHFSVKEIAAGGEVAWARWTAHTPRGVIEGCGVYRILDGQLTYYCDYMNAG